MISKLVIGGFSALCVLSLCIGVDTLMSGGFGQVSDGAWLTLTASRIPRLVSVLLTGAGLSLCGVILQQLLRNRFVEPATTGGLDAAKLGILISVAVSGTSTFEKTAIAFGVCLLAIGIFVTFVYRLRLKNPLLIPVAGLMYGAVLSGGAEFYAVQNNMMQSMQGWLLGDFSKIVVGHYEIVWLLLPLIIGVYACAHQLTIMGMGRDMANSLGISYAAMASLALIVVSLTTSITVIAVGAIPFLGLAVPNLVALYYGDNLARTLPLVALAGAGLLLFCDLLSRLLIYPFEVPIGITAGGLGGCLFLLLIWRKRL